MKDREKFDYLNNERELLWKKVLELEKLLEEKTSDLEKDARQSSKKASEYRNRSNEAYEVAKKNSEQIALLNESATEKLASISEKLSEVQISFNDVNEYAEEINLKKEKIEECISTLEINFENNESLIEKLETLNTNFEEGETLKSKIETLHKSLQPKKKDIDNIYREIFGYTDTNVDEVGDETEIKIEGLKDQLEETYNNLEENLEQLTTTVEETKKQTSEKYKNFLIEKESSYSVSLENWNKEHSVILNKINKLLPNALTTGLSYAYSEKKESEVKESINYSKNFKYAAFGLIGMSIIPFLLSIVFIWQGKPLHDVILDSPRFVLAIIPMYIPILWIAYSSNKKLNLSKRLIEEYTHKEVLSKTFEGLSHQIDSIADHNLSADLRIKLLYNILSVSSENPGKLISDYNKSDHPLMDALDKSASLSDAVEKLENIPGLSKIARILDKKARRIVKEQADKIDATLGEIVEETLDDSVN